MSTETERGMQFVVMDQHKHTDWKYEHEYIQFNSCRSHRNSWYHINGCEQGRNSEKFAMHIWKIIERRAMHDEKSSFAGKPSSVEKEANPNQGAIQPNEQNRFQLATKSRPQNIELFFFCSLWELSSVCFLKPKKLRFSRNLGGLLGLSDDGPLKKPL